MENRFEMFTVSIARISRAIRKIENLEMKDMHLRSFHVECLYYLYATDANTATKLCEKCGEDKATISRTLEYLETNGYVVREKTEKKRYNSVITLSNLGKETGKLIADKIEHVLMEVSFDLKEEERNTLYSCLFRIAERLDAICEENA